MAGIPTDLRRSAHAAASLPACASGCSVLQQARKQLRERDQRTRRLAAELTMAEERQRRRIAEDLHDHLGQALALLRFKLHAIQSDAVFCGFDSALGDMDKLLAQTIRYTRSLTNEISPPVLHEFGLLEACSSLVETIGRKSGLNIDLRGELSADLVSQPVQVALYRSVRELLLNAVKHANANHAEVSFSVQDDLLTITVTDDGDGFIVDESSLRCPKGEDTGFGLFFVGERLRDLGGRILVRSELGQGTSVRLEFALDIEERKRP